MRLIFVTLLFSLVAGAQDTGRMESLQPQTQFQVQKQLFDAPSAAKPRPKPSAWRYQWRPWDDQLQERTFGETLRSPWFILPFATLLAMNAADIEATRASGCGEKQDFGRHPSRFEQYGNDFAGDLVVGGLAFAAHKLRFSYIPHGMFGYGIFLHTRGFIHGLHANCH